MYNQLPLMFCKQVHTHSLLHLAGIMANLLRVVTNKQILFDSLFVYHLIC